MLRTIPSGWRNSPSQLQSFTFVGESGPIEVGYRFDRTGLQVCVGGQPVPAVLRSCREVSVEIEINGVLRSFNTHRVDSTWYVDSVLGHSALTEQSRFPSKDEHAQPGSLTSPLPGRVVAVEVNADDRVAKGDTLIVIEAMKMEHAVKAPTAGVVASIRVEANQQVEADEVLAVITPDTA